MNQAYLNIAAGLMWLIIFGWRWYEGKLNLGVFSVAVFHLVMGFFMALVGFLPEKGMRYYFTSRTEYADSYIIANIREKSYFNLIFIGVEVVVAAVGLAMLFALPHKRKIHRVVLILVTQAFCVILALIVYEVILDKLQAFSVTFLNPIAAEFF